MSSMDLIQDIHQNIFHWYQKNQRAHLPWRKTRDPYKILVSEVMLQQTQVDRVIPKYREFLRAFPSVKTLAEAKTGDVIRAWKGLGYNRRALFLQKTAQAIVGEYGGKFPNDLEELKKLPGIGDYTARAVLSFAFKEPLPVLDTNHRRFYQRVFFGMREKSDAQLLKKAEEVVKGINNIDPSLHRGGRGRGVNAVRQSPVNAPSRSLMLQACPQWHPLLASPYEGEDPSLFVFDVYHWNQALMDFGSLICTAKNPKCAECPIQKWCRAYPVILRKSEKARKRESQNVIPFLKTDRYVRGRIIDALREKQKVSLAVLRKNFPHITDDRYERIVVHLEKDGLIARRGSDILLP